LIQEGKKFLA